MEEALIILKKIQNKLMNRNNEDDQQIANDINNAIKIISEHKCISNNSELIEFKETIKELKEENNKMNMNNKDMKNEIDKLTSLFKEYKEELQKFKNEKTNKELFYIYEVNKSGKYRILGDKFVENNKNKGYLIINGKRTEELEIYANLVEGKNEITIVFSPIIVDFSCMFNVCLCIVKT